MGRLSVATTESHFGFGLDHQLCAGMDCPRVQYEDLNKAVGIELQQQGLQILQDSGQQVDKVVQLYEASAILSESFCDTLV